MLSRFYSGTTVITQPRVDGPLHCLLPGKFLILDNFTFQSFPLSLPLILVIFALFLHFTPSILGMRFRIYVEHTPALSFIYIAASQQLSHK